MAQHSLCTRGSAKNGNIDLVYRNVGKLVEAKAKLGKRTPVVCWHYLAFEHNAHEISLAADAARSLGVDIFQVIVPFDVSWDDPGIHPADVVPLRLEFNPDSEQDIIENWNPFPSDLDTKTIEREYEAGWTVQLASHPQRDSGPAAIAGHTCPWLYKNTAMDANGRIFPCWGAPGQGADLTYANIDGIGGSKSFNSDKYRLARLFFADLDAYQRERCASGLDRDPHCVNCTWPQDEAGIDHAQVEHYLRAAADPLFNAKSMNMLSSW